MRVELPTLKVKAVRDLTDVEIRELAMREAERAVQRAINEQIAAEKVTRARAGIAF